MKQDQILWPDIGRGRYGADMEGNIYSNASGDLKMLKPAISQGYAVVFLSFGRSDKKRVSVHRIVANAHLPMDESRKHINHKNGIKTDNRSCNLEWVTPKENMQHAILTGLFVPNRKLSDRQISDAAVMRRSGKKFREIAECLGCSISTAYEIIAENSNKGAA